MNVAVVRKLLDKDGNELNPLSINDEVSTRYRTLGFFFFNDIDELIICIDEREDPSFCEYLLLDNFKGGIYLEGEFSTLMDNQWRDFVDSSKEPDDSMETEYFPLEEFKYCGRSEGVFESIFDAMKSVGWKPLVEE